MSDVAKANPAMSANDNLAIKVLRVIKHTSDDEVDDWRDKGKVVVTDLFLDQLRTIIEAFDENGVVWRLVPEFVQNPEIQEPDRFTIYV